MLKKASSDDVAPEVVITRSCLRQKLFALNQKLLRQNLSWILIGSDDDESA
jgi:hypothetical protein